jgi:hypothetical protein
VRRSAKSGLMRGPGAVLVTPRGLTVANTVAVARRPCGKNFVTSVTGGGTGRATDPGGTLRGLVLSITYPLRSAP